MWVRQAIVSGDPQTRIEHLKNALAVYEKLEMGQAADWVRNLLESMK